MQLQKEQEGQFTLEGQKKYYLATVDESQLFSISNYLSSIISIHREKEGLALIFEEEILDIIRQFTTATVKGPFALVTVSVGSGISAIALLSKKKIDCNLVSSYNHNYLFVSYEQKDDAIVALKNL